ncbi:MAG: type I DNA topoisomerase, partial [Candidatus Roizmanbacteria bacterium]|nr:type I DNA topoisomerase [Candidatus Roizmanbacteria bacterium]
PTKARTFNYILKSSASAEATADKKNYFVFATMGHVRDLPKSKIAIDYEKDFKPDYEVIKNKEKVIDQLKKLAQEDQEIILATDLDREGESISYHIAYILGYINEDWPNIGFKDGVSLKRIVFHEITAKALTEALANPETLRLDLIKAQFARRILDRIVGYELSPLLWKKTGKNWLSAGRVQTVALRLIVEREKEIKAFKSEDYFQIFGEFEAGHPKGVLIKAKLISKENIPYEQKYTLKLFAGDYQYTKTTINKDNVEIIKQDCLNDKYKVLEVKESIDLRYPMPPYTTSLLQQDAYYKHGFSSKQTMRLAQDLYERGLITYHRTDSFNLSARFVFPAKEYIEKKFGKEYALDKPRGFRTRSKSAQEAHEAIRPTKLLEMKAAFKGKKESKLTINHQRLYTLIFNRAIATQMKEAQIKTVKTEIISDKNYFFESEQQQVIFDGFLKVFDPYYVTNHQTIIKLEKDSLIEVKSLEEKALISKPPPRYNEASLIRALEEKGIGRPSTYAMIISLIQMKNYTEKDGRYFVPTSIGTSICDYLSINFSQIFDLSYTASLEEGLDKIANREEDFIKLLKDFYQPFKKELEIRKEDKSLIKIEDDVKGICPDCGGNLISRFSRFGKFIACSNYPKCKYTKSIVKIVKNRKCPLCQGDVVVKFTKSKKRFYGCGNYPKCRWSSWSLKEIGKSLLENRK